jgi:hypothetical protein
MRFKTFLCTVALAAALAPAAWADEYNRQTYLTFSGPVQLPGITLPAGTYMLKLADPGNGMLNAIQVWDRSGKHLYKTLQTMRNRRSEAPKDPIVMFKETVAGQPQAVQSWFYPNDSAGFEFIWPRNEALKLAQASHGSVLTSTDESAKSVSRIDESGKLSEVNGSPDTVTTTESSSRSSAAAAPAPETASAPPATSTPVATSGAASSQVARNETTQANPPRRTLPRTAGETGLIELTAGLSLLGAVLVRSLRKRVAEAVS